jgi:hypothetical protein
MNDATNGGPAGEPTDLLSRLARIPRHPRALGPETGWIVWHR